MAHRYLTELHALLPFSGLRKFLCLREAQKHWKAVNFANTHGTKQPASFFYSQVDKDAQKADRAAKLKVAREKDLEETKGLREQKRAEKEGAANRKRTERKKV